jgi:hypothetical protein
MPFEPPPPFAAWRHRDAREGFEVLFLHAESPGLRLEGQTAAVEAGQAWTVAYSIVVDASWTTVSARAVSRSASGRREIALESDGPGAWSIDGAAAPRLDGCLDVDLESSACTNALPVHRLRLAIGEAAQAPAVYVRAANLAVERLEQRYARLADDGGRERYAYSAPRFDYAGELVYDAHGLLLGYPGLAVRAA